MKKSTFYLLVLIAIISGISYYNMQLFDLSDAERTVKSEYTDYFPTPEIGDLYVFKTADSLRFYLKIQAEISKDSFAIIYGKEKATIKDVESYQWAKAIIESDVTFNSRNRVKTNLAGLKNLFQQENFVLILRVKTEPTNEDLEQTPWYVSLIMSFYGFPIMVIFAFLFVWLFGIIGDFLRNYFPKVSSKIGYILLTLLGMFTFFKSVNHPIIFSHAGIALFYSVFCVGVPMWIFYFLDNRIFSKKDFADREALRLLGLSLMGILIGLLAFVIYILIGRFLAIIGNSENIVGGMTIFIYPVSLIWFAFATGNFLNNLRQNFNQLKIKEQQLAKAQKNELSSKAELDALQARINPHFLYNSLNSIASLAQVDPKKTEEMAIALSQFYKYSTNRADEHLTSVAEEVEILKTYLDIEKIRFGERLQFQIEVSELKNDWQIPRFLLQPLAENAVKHGYNKTTNQIFIKVIISDSETQLKLQILDSGTPFLENMKIGYGLSSIQKKLQLLFPERHNLAFVNEPEKAVVIEIY